MNIQRVSRTPNCHHCNDSEISPLILYSFINHPPNFSTNSTTTCATPQPCAPNTINHNPSLFRSHHSGLIVPPDDCGDLVSPSINTSSECSFSSFQAENLHDLLDSLDDLPHYSVFQNNSIRDKNVQVPECFLDDQLHHDHNLDEMLKTSVGPTPAPKTVDLDHKDINEKTTTTTDYKQRIRWTTELHDLFLDAIQTLGGPQYATPKKILGIMNVKGLSIYHVKSHLQKYRLAKNVPDLRHEKRGSTSCTENKLTYDNIDAHINSDNMPVTEALRMQLQLQKLLHDQLKSQKDLQVRIEQNGELLRKLIEKQNNTNQSLAKADDHSSPSDSSVNEFSSTQPSASD